MSKRGRRRSRRRKSSSSSKQSVSPFIFHNHNRDEDGGCRDDVVEKGEADSFRRENTSASEHEDNNNVCPPQEKRFKVDRQNQRHVYTRTTQDTEGGVKVVTSVSVIDLEESSPNVTFQQLRQPPGQNASSSPVTNVMTISCSGSKVKVEIQESLQINASGVRTTFVFNDDGNDEETPDNQAPSQKVSTDKNYTLTFENQKREVNDSNCEMWEEPNCCHCCCRNKQLKDYWSMNCPSTPTLLLNIRPQERRKRLHTGCGADPIGNIPPPQEFADGKLNTLDKLAFELASCRIPAAEEPEEEPRCFAEEREDPPLSPDQFSESENYESTLTRPSVSTNRSSFTNDFIRSQRGRSWVRNNSFAALEHRACAIPRRRRQTFPGTLERVGSMQEDLLLLPCPESFTSLVMCSRPLQSENQGKTHNKCSAFGKRDETKENSAESHRKHSWLSPFCVMSSEENPDETFRLDGEGADECKVDASDVMDSGFDQDMMEYQDSELGHRTLCIQVIPPSCSGSEEQVLQNHPVAASHDHGNIMEGVRRDSACVKTLSVATLQHRLLHLDLGSHRGHLEKPSSQDVHSSNTNQETESQTLATETGSTSAPLPPVEAQHRGTGGGASASSPVHQRQQLRDKEKHRRPSSGIKEHQEPTVHTETEGGGGGGGSDHWARRRKLFKESKQWSSAGGSSVTSDITEESVSEESRSTDRTSRDEAGGFYTETFHSSAWIYQGDEAESGLIPPSLNSRTRAVSIRERTVRISKGTGEYPWGFRIQFSKPIVVTEVDTNGAGEEAGLIVGDFVVAVNGTDVTSVPHSEAADLARQGPDILTLTIGSDIARVPNTPRPACRGYLHKRTQSGLIKGWRKRWFVLAHDNCLYYYRHKRDEGKRQPLSAVKLEGAEVGRDLSLGKPFVFKCRPLAVNRVFFFCATSNQEMKRWLEAMERAVQPVIQNHVWVDVTRHNSSLPPLAVKSPECLGLLHKLDRNKDTWVQHYCILKDACLYLYSGIRATHAHGGIYLQGYTVREQPHGFRKSTIELKPPSDEFKTFYFSAENPNENKRWMVAIKASVKKWLLLHEALQDYMNRPPEETRM